MLDEHGFTGGIGSILEHATGPPVDSQTRRIGRLLFFDTTVGLNNDNKCAGCHSPQHGFGDTQSIAIGIENNGIVGAGSRGPAQSAPHTEGRQHGLLSRI